MKTKLLFAMLISSFAFAQIPAGYYSTATGTGYTLKTQLYNKIKGHTDRGYAGLWTTYATSDRDNQYENDNSIIDIYSENPTGVDPYKYILNTNQCGTYSIEGNCYNREHVVPQSSFNSASPMVGDAHHIPPTDGKVNGIRSNYPHGKVAVASITTRNGSKLGTSGISGYVGTVFEPINEFKGDIARMYFYFATRYENTVSGYTAFAMFNGTSNQVFKPAFLAMLKTWHNQDPVSAREIARNNAIYARQGNRNPFIDRPEFVVAIWGAIPAARNSISNDEILVKNIEENEIDFDAQSIEEKIQMVFESNLENKITNDFEIYPNPSNGNFNIDLKNATDEVSIEIYSLFGDKIFETLSSENKVIAVSNLKKGIYLIKINQNEDIITKKLIIN
jgi:endonuclease I